MVAHKLLAPKIRAIDSVDAVDLGGGALLLSIRAGRDLYQLRRAPGPILGGNADKGWQTPQKIDTGGIPLAAAATRR